jgi:uncharacterized protein (DUF305 family)
MQQWLKQWYGITKEPMISPESKTVVERLSGLSGADFEITFLREMIKHHQMGIPMMEPAAKYAVHPAAREMAKKMIFDQRNEIRLMQRWLKMWYNVTASQ